ncbi:MAG: hypothetical protein GXP14_05675 [Gammaproteobacteria bacterium]|nr:hypothetical protein [Gammaproteobacteria bacterium]
MYKRAVFYSFISMAVVLLTGCSLGMSVTGSAVMLKGDLPMQPSPVEQVQILLETENIDYQVVALVNASVSLAEPVDIAIAEGKVLQELKNQAALAGANGILEVVREVLVGDALISTMRYGGVDGHSPLDHNTLDHDRHDLTQTLPIEYSSIDSSRTSISQSYTVYFRGKAVRF